MPGGNQVTIGIIGTGDGTGTAVVNTTYTVGSVAQAQTLFGSNTANGAHLMKMIIAAFQEGASSIVAASVGAPTLGTASTLSAAASAGATTITVTAGTGYTAGDIIFLGTGQTYAYEERRVIASISTNVITLTTALTFNHYIGETAQKVTEKASSAYTTAITNMQADESKSIALCELNDAATAVLMVAMVYNSYSLYNTPCVYIQAPEYADTDSTFIAKATAHNDNRVIMPFPLLTDFNGKTVTPGETAAALAGLIAGDGVPKLNHNYAAFTGFGGVVEKIANMDALLAVGITPIELKYNTIHIVRLLTTQATVNGVPNTQWQEGSVRLNVDFIEKAVASALQKSFLQSGNTPQTRLAIAAEVNSILSGFTGSQILIANPATNTPAFTAPVVSTDPSNSTRVIVAVQISPGKPLNFIALNFKVYL